MQKFIDLGPSLKLSYKMEILTQIHSMVLPDISFFDKLIMTSSGWKC